jgi:hypothetical protein
MHMPTDYTAEANVRRRAGHSMGSLKRKTMKAKRFPIFPGKVTVVLVVTTFGVEQLESFLFGSDSHHWLTATSER